MRRIQEVLSSDDVLIGADGDKESALSATALKEKRLTFTWLEGEAQKVSLVYVVLTRYLFITHSDDASILNCQGLKVYYLEELLGICDDVLMLIEIASSYKVVT